MCDLRKPSLNDWWQDVLNERMGTHYPDVIGFGVLVDSWKRDGWNDGTTTLFGVYRDNEGVYRECRFPDYGEATSRIVQPRFEHTGWIDDKEPSV